MSETLSCISSTQPVCAPVGYIGVDSERQAPKPGKALCLSGGGYRAMLFHIGSLWRLYEIGMLADLDRVSSVSGGSITAAVIGLAWGRLIIQGGSPSRACYEAEVVEPLRRLASETIDVPAVLGGLLFPGMISERIERAYAKYLFKDATLQALPDKPRFVINASNLQSGALWRFSKPYMRDYRVGKVSNPDVPMAKAVAASSAFPPLLSPLVMKLDPSVFTPHSGQDLQYEPFTSRVVLSDGGVYDNLGLETAWKYYQTVLVSDAGGKMRSEPTPKKDWILQSYRVLNLIDNQVRSLRKRLLIQSYRDRVRTGTYWGIRTDIADYGPGWTLPCPFQRTLALAEIPTRLKRMPAELQERLINWGYAVCDAALRRWMDPALPPPTGFPYSRGV